MIRFPVATAAVAMFVASFLVPPTVHAADYIRTEDVAYAQRDGQPLTLDVFEPKGSKNGAGIIVCISGGFKSSKDILNMVSGKVIPEFTQRGYVVFAVLHSNTPKYSVPEMIDDMHQAVRFIKVQADKYRIQPDKLGIAGASSGGCLSLMIGCNSRPARPTATDPLERQSSQVAAVACFYPPTDFLRYEEKPPANFDYDGLFPYRKFDARANKYIPIDKAERQAMGKACSPFHCANEKAAPTLIIHGDKDELVPLEQSEILIKKLTHCGVRCEIVVKKGFGHDPLMVVLFRHELADWFDEQLLNRPRKPR
ncbi:MAG: alpha/beta hydrolase fold domain-containing protein [Gemmataceae bacterium]|nr:alpha/beta hydrolase fold domain-containing protein [Gemmata sp.]MDW8199131.1 alpha/beta hydrolase fold domain-containing protein [Gemmataceae bacterium]